MPCDISVIVLTRDRRSDLREALASLVRQTLDPDRYEILVVDNGSTDGTADLAREVRCWNAHMRYLRDPSPGVGTVRNTGWMAASGDLIAFMDDDAIASPEWLEILVRGFEENGPKVACIGGQVQLFPPLRLPAWLPDGLTGYLSGVHLSHTPIPVQGGLICANLAVRRAALEAVGGFDPRLGRRPGTMLSREETCLTRMLVARGDICLYLPNAIVRHRITPARLTRRWFRKRMYWEGVGLAIEDRICEDLRGSRRVLQVLRGSGRLVWPPWRLCSLLLPTRRPRAFLRHCETIRDIGYVRGAARDLPVPEHRE